MKSFMIIINKTWQLFIGNWRNRFNTDIYQNQYYKNLKILLKTDTVFKKITSTCELNADVWERKENMGRVKRKVPSNMRKMGRFR